MLAESEVKTLECDKVDPPQSPRDGLLAPRRPEKERQGKRGFFKVVGLTFRLTFLGLDPARRVPNAISAK